MAVTGGGREAMLELLLGEMSHRCANDLQMAMGLLRLQARRSAHAEAATALEDGARRIGVLADARSAFAHGREPRLDVALRQICDALQARSQGSSIAITLEVDGACDGLSSDQVTVLSLAVNELVTNAIKHGFENAEGGHVGVSVQRRDGEILVAVEDDGRPLMSKRDGGLGLTIVDRLTASVGARFATPDGVGKRFTISVPHDG